MKRRKNNYHKLQKAPEKTAQDQTQPPQEVLQDQNQSRAQGRDQNQSHGQGRGQNQGRNRDRNQDQSHDRDHDQDRGHKVVLDKVVQDEVDQVLQMQEGRGQGLDRNQEVDHVQDRDHLRAQEVQEVEVHQVNQAEEADRGPEVQVALVQIDRKESCFLFFCKFQLLYFCTFFGIIKPLRRFIQRKRNIVINLHT